jgi:hypothetical protein
MLELTLATLLSTMSEDFCVLMEKNDDIVKSTLLAYSEANKKYGPDNVIKVVSDANPIELRALALTNVATKCPNKL